MYNEADFFAVQPEQGSLFTNAQPLPDKAIGPLYQQGEQGKLFCVVCGVALDSKHTFVCMAHVADCRPLAGKRCKHDRR